MQRTLTAVVLASVLLVLLGVDGVTGDEPAAVDQAYKEMIDQRREHDEMSERLALTKEFLQQYPESKYTARLIGHVYYYQAEQLGDVPGAIEYAEDLRAKLTDPDIISDFDRRMVELYGEAGMLDRMSTLAGRLEEEGEMKFGDYWNVIEIATNNEKWKMVREYCGKAKPLTTADAYRSDYPQYDFTDEEVRKAADNRSGMVAGKDAWALANLGRADEAMAGFETAGKTLNRSYIGVLDYDIGLYWAKTLLMEGDYDGAIDRFAPEALIMGDEDALAGLKKAYVGKNGGEDGFAAFAGKLHAAVAPRVKEFELPDYQGERNEYGDIKGEVTLLAFWFPT
jgi:tetratricopeptide (TPR) repeat protein